MKMIENLFMVDDDEIYLFLAKKAIQDAGVTKNIKLFHNGKDAIDFLEANSDATHHLPDLIFLDITMPVMDGWEFLEEYVLLKPRLNKKVTIYMVSSSISPTDIEKAKSISAVTDYIIKPVSKELYVEIVKKIA